jgi:hypothetical protein
MLLAVVACAGDRAPRQDTTRASRAATPRPGAPARVDSILPIEEELRRFRADLADTARALRGGEASRDALVRRFVEAVESSDTAAVRAMLLTASEFAWLYYPSSINARPPYELGPGLAWFQLQNGSSKGISRAWQRFAGRPLGVAGHDCPAPTGQGGNTIRDGCRLVRVAAGDTTSIRLFGAIVEREGRFKFLSYANDL